LLVFSESEFHVVCLIVSLFDAAILTAFELSTKSFLKIFFLVSRQSSINRQLGIVKAVFDRQLFFRQSSRYRQLIVNSSSIVNRQSSIVNSSSTWQKIHLFCAVFRLFPGIGVGLCYLCMRDALRKVLHFLAFQLFKKFFKKNL
jgi:hypothetical protein